MFRRPAKPTPTDQSDIHQQMSALRAENEQLLSLVSYLENAALQMDSSIQESEYLMTTQRHEAAPIMAAMKHLQLHLLARLPLALHRGDPNAEAAFTSVFGYSPSQFQNPVLVAAELLGFRMHTASRILLDMAAGKRVDAAEVEYQARNDVSVTMSHEQTRYNQRALERGRT